MNVIENVIVDNGFSKHKIQWVYSPSEIINLANRVLFSAKKDVVNEINSKNLTVLIKTNTYYSDLISKTIVDADNELLFRFNNVF